MNLDSDMPVSMNFWGFNPTIFSRLEALFEKFMEESGKSPGDEFFLPSAVDMMIGEGASVRVLETSARWFGMTYIEDRDHAVRAVRELIDEGIYPENLWED